MPAGKVYPNTNVSTDYTQTTLFDSFLMMKTPTNMPCRKESTHSKQHQVSFAYFAESAIESIVINPSVRLSVLWQKVVKTFIDSHYHKLHRKLHSELFLLHSIDGSMYVCHNCSQVMKTGGMPPQAKANKLASDEISEAMQDLRPLEVRLIARCIQFIKLIELPAGRQQAIVGQCCNVVTNLQPVTSLLLTEEMIGAMNLLRQSTTSGTKMLALW